MFKGRVRRGAAPSRIPIFGRGGNSEDTLLNSVDHASHPSSAAMPSGEFSNVSLEFENPAIRGQVATIEPGPDRLAADG